MLAKSPRKPWYIKLKNLGARHMKNLATAFVSGSFAVGIIGVTAQFYWKLPSLGKILYSVAGFLFVLGLVLFAIVIHHEWGTVTPRQAKRDERLKTHFRKLQEAMPSIIPVLTRNHGDIAISNPSGFAWDRSIPITEDNVHEFPMQFAAHFPNESDMWNELREQIHAHNSSYKDFLAAVTAAFHDCGLNVRAFDDQYNQPYIEGGQFFFAMFRYYSDRLERSHNIGVNFNEMNATMLAPGRFAIQVSGHGGEIAYATSQVDIDSSIRAMRGTITKFEQRGIRLVSTANAISGKCYDLRTKLNETMQAIADNWPGTTQAFKLVKRCPECKNLQENL